MCRISVIVPVYNLERYLARCVSSLTGQTFSDLEIILVDDGSTDGSPALCDALVREDARIRVIHKANGGLASARNAGLEAAAGDYISFIDGDDYIDIDAYARMAPVLTEYAPDLLRFGYRKIGGGRELARCVLDYPEGLSTAAALDELKLDTISYPNVLDYGRQRILSACTNLYRRAFLEEHHLRFVSEREVLNEDYLFVLQAMQCAQRVYLHPEAYYCYDTRGNSLTTSYRQRMYQRKQALFDAYCRSLPVDDPEVALRLDNFYIDCIYACILNECTMSTSRRRAIGEIRMLLRDKRLGAALKRNKSLAKSAKSRCICLLMEHRMAALCYYGYRLMTRLKG